MRFLLACVLIAIAVGPALAQNPGWPRVKTQPKTGGYVHFDFDPNVEALVKDRLKIEPDLGPFKDLVKQILANPEQFPLDLQKFKGAKLDDPAMKKAVQNWLAQEPELKQNVADWIRQQPADQKAGDVAKLQQELQAILKEAPAAKPNSPDMGADNDESKKAPGPDFDPFAKAAERAVKQAQESELGQWLSDSPGWNRALQDLQTSLQNPNDSRWQAGDWQKRFGINEKQAWRFSADALKRLQGMPRPNFEGAAWRRSVPGAGVLRRLDIGPPALPNYSALSMPSVGTAATWVLLLFATLLFAWQMMRWTRAAPGAEQRSPRGPWPVSPGAVSTRAELVQAFDYLALGTLGQEVGSWNHQAVTEALERQTPELAPFALALASLYEASRYTEGNDELTTAQRDQARQALTRLAEALR